MNPSQLRETTMDPRTRRLVQLTIAAKDDSDQLMDMMLAKKRASDRRTGWKRRATWPKSSPDNGIRIPCKTN